MVSDEFRIRSGFTLSPETFLVGLKEFESQKKKKKKKKKMVSAFSNYRKLFPFRTRKKWACTIQLNLFPTQEQKKILAILTFNSLAWINRWFRNQRRIYMKRLKLKASRETSDPYQAPLNEEQMEESTEDFPEENSLIETANKEHLSSVSESTSCSSRGTASNSPGILSQEELKRLLDAAIKNDVRLQTFVPHDIEMNLPSTSESVAVSALTLPSTSSPLTDIPEATSNTYSNNTSLTAPFPVNIPPSLSIPISTSFPTSISAPHAHSVSDSFPGLSSTHIQTPILTSSSSPNSVPISPPILTPITTSISNLTPARIPPSLLESIPPPITASTLTPTSNTPSTSTTSPCFDDQSLIFSPLQHQTLPDIDPLMNESSLRKLLLNYSFRLTVELSQNVVDVLQPQIVREILRAKAKDITKDVDAPSTSSLSPPFSEPRQIELPNPIPELTELQRLLLFQALQLQLMYANPLLLAALFPNSSIPFSTTGTDCTISDTSPFPLSLSNSQSYSAPNNLLTSEIPIPSLQLKSGSPSLSSTAFSDKERSALNMLWSMSSKQT